MGQRSIFRQADLEKAIRAAMEAGLPIAGFRILPTGEIDVRCAGPASGDDFDLTDMRR